MRKKNQFHVAKCKPDFALFSSILSSGVPSLVTEVSSGIVMIIFNSIILRLEGNVGVAAYGVIANISLVVMAVYTGIAQGIQPIISKYYGLKNIKNINSTLKYALTSMLIISVVVYMTIFFCAAGIAGIFNSEQNAMLQAIASNGLRIYFIAAPFAGFNIIISVYFTSTERQRPAHLISLLRGFIIIIPSAFLFSALFDIVGVWCSFFITEAIVSIIAMCLYAAAKKRLRRSLV